MCRVATDRPVFHLTFDDGPHPEVTPRVLDVLEEFGAPATFFLLADQAKKHPDVVEETLRRGHEVGLHGRTHLRLSTADWRSLLDETARSRREMEEVVGRGVEYFRPPYGDHDLRSRAMVWAQGMKSVLWSVDTYDWRGIRRGDSLRAITDAVIPGGIVLIHDTPIGKTIAEERARGLIAKEDLTRAVLSYLYARGLTSVSLTELAGSGREIRRFQPMTAPSECLCPPGTLAGDE